MHRDDIERLTRVESKLDEVHEDVRELALMYRDRLAEQDHTILTTRTDIAGMKTQLKLLIGILGAIASIAGVPWVATLLK
jgi:hypothetical protein